jgi:catechol 2,3-dioxygenase-like lactoylglutathione lyase family enzyme
MIERLHHAAYRCQDSEATRSFYEDFLGLPLTDAFVISETQTGRKTQVLHLFFGLPDGSSIAFFEAPEQPFEFVDQHDFDLHIALKVPQASLTPMLDLAARQGIEHRGISDHGFIHSVYFRDPNGYVVELAADIEAARDFGDKNDPHEVLANWGRN